MAKAGADVEVIIFAQGEGHFERYGTVGVFYRDLILSLLRIFRIAQMAGGGVPKTQHRNKRLYIRYSFLEMNEHDLIGQYPTAVLYEKPRVVDLPAPGSPKNTAAVPSGSRAAEPCKRK